MDEKQKRSSKLEFDSDVPIACIYLKMHLLAQISMNAKQINSLWRMLHNLTDSERQWRARAVCLSVAEGKRQSSVAPERLTQFLAGDDLS